MLKPKERLINVARVLKSNGTDGQIVLSFRDYSPEEINLQEPVFIYFDGSPVPFFISDFDPRGNRAYAYLTDICSEADTAEVIGREVYVEEGTIEGYESDEEDMSFLVGWTLFKATSRRGRPVKIGEIVSFEDIPSNPCIGIISGGEEVLVPLHEDLIVGVDAERCEIVMNIPEGLL